MSGFHRPAPDYTGPRFRVPAATEATLRRILTELYGAAAARRACREIVRLMQVYRAHKTPAMTAWERGFEPAERFTERDAILITYGDLVRETGRPPLDCLRELATHYLRDVFSILHILPFFPYSSDRGFAVINFRSVDRNLGTWDNIIALKEHFRLMFDGVFNHVSAQSPWFREFLDGNPVYRNFFTSFRSRDAVSDDDLRRILRTLLDAVAPHVALVTETNVPHADNVSYFGDGTHEAQMVYNFALPPLVLHTFHTGDARRLCAWAASLQHVSPTATYLNFLDSHDGIGLMGARGILSDAELHALCRRTIAHGGHVSFKHNSDGTESPYELNITSYSALNREDSGESADLQVRRYLAARSIPLALMGVPGIYLHGLLGSTNDIEAVRAGGEKRSINRRNLDKRELFSRLDDPASTTARIVRGLVTMLSRRTAHRAFHPNAAQHVCTAPDALFALRRTAADATACVLAVTNVTAREQALRLDAETTGVAASGWRDLLSGRTLDAPAAAIPPYGVLWLEPDDGR